MFERDGELESLREASRRQEETETRQDKEIGKRQEKEVFLYIEHGSLKNEMSERVSGAVYV
jgi:hypothetical protein